MKVKYFAWVRERVGMAEETVEPPADVRTVDDLIGWLSSRGEAYAYAFEKPKVIRAAIDHAHVKPDADDLRRPRDCVLPADDRRLSRSDDRCRDHPHPGSRFRHRAGNRGADQGPHRYRRGRQLSAASAAAARTASRSPR